MNALLPFFSYLAQSNKISAPQFVATPQDVLVREGATVTLDCAANGNPRPRISWLKDGATIDLAYATPVNTVFILRLIFDI